MPQFRFEWDTVEPAIYQQSLERMRAALAPEAFALAWAEGQAMTVDEVITYALEEDSP